MTKHYKLSKEDERKLRQLAETRGVTPDKLISQLLAAAPEYQSKEEAPAPEPTVAQIEQEYLEQIAELQKQLAATVDSMRNLQQ